MTLCNTFKCLAFNTWNFIQRGRNAVFQLKEETITDINLLEIKTRHPGQVWTYAFNKREEGNVGADWEWWFQGADLRWIGFRVQAKIISIYSSCFEHLHYKNQNTNIYQCDKLIQNALSQNPPSIPLYCFYIQTDDSSHLNDWSCASIPPLKDFYGCSLTSAFTVRQLRVAKDDHITDLQNELKPWHCLVCCTGFGGNGNFIENIEAYAMKNFSFPKDDNDAIPERFSTDKPPKYVLSILENPSNKEITPPDKEIDGVLVFKERS